VRTVSPVRRTARIASTNGRADLVVHAAAQLPDDIAVEVFADGAERRTAQQLAAAYGIEDQIAFRSSENGSSSMLQGPTGSDDMARFVESLYHGVDDAAVARRAGVGLAGHRVALVTNIPAPYRISLFNRLHHRLEEAGAELRVFFLRAETARRSWMSSQQSREFDYEVLSSIELPFFERGPMIPANLDHRLRMFRPTAVLVGSLSPLVAGRAAVQARRLGAAFGLWSGETRAMKTASSGWRAAPRKWVANRADFAVAYGFEAGEYLRALSPDLPLVYGRNTSDRYPPAGGDRQPGLTLDLLAVGAATSPRKGLDVLIDAMRLVPDLPCRLTIVGGGRLLADLRERGRADPRIDLVGALPPPEVCEHYRAADGFLFPTRADVFGLVLVEAMGAGLPAVTSTDAGAVSDVAVHEHNCLVVDGHDPRDWARAIERLVRDDHLRATLGERAARTIRSRWTVEHAVDGMVAGLRLGLSRR
jgi:glycosyltransferase involved in cell wall biosynthesis